MSSTRVDFYLLTEAQPTAVWLFACRFLEKAYLRQHKIFVYCDNQKDAEHLDELLWTFKDDSFIPHHLQGEGPLLSPPIQIGYQQEPRGFHDILLNLSKVIPPFYTRFQRVIEIVSGEDAAKMLSREHYRIYRQQGCELETHTI